MLGWMITRSLNGSLVQCGHSAGGPGGKHKASVAMTVWQKRRCILALQPNATLIFSLANLQLSLHSLFVSLSSLLLSVTLQLSPASHANPKSAAVREEDKCAKTLWAGQQYPRGVTLLPVTTAKLQTKGKWSMTLGVTHLLTDLQHSKNVSPV